MRKATLFFAPEFLRKNQKVGETNSPFVIPALPTDKDLPVAPNCPVRALKYYHRRTSEPSVRKGRKKLFIPLKDNHQGMEISTSTISRWLCTIISLAHDQLPRERRLELNINAHEVRAVATSLHLFHSSLPKAVMQAGRWRSDSAFASHYLRDLASIYEDLIETGPLVAASRVITIPTSHGE